MSNKTIAIIFFQENYPIPVLPYVTSKNILVDQNGFRIPLNILDIQMKRSFQISTLWIYIFDAGAVMAWRGAAAAIINLV